MAALKRQVKGRSGVLFCYQNRRRSGAAVSADTALTNTAADAPGARQSAGFALAADSETNWLYLLMKAEPSLRLVGVSREGHACSIAAGLSTGGAKPLILIQNTGMMESGDSLRGWLLGLNIPVVLMVGYRGWTRHGVNQDTAATYTERFLNAFGINYYLVESDADAPRITVAFEETERTKKPVVVLVGDEYHGFNR